MNSVTYKIVLILVCVISIWADIPTTPNFICLPNPPYLKSMQLSTPFSTCSAETKQSIAQRHPDQNLLTVKIMKPVNFKY